MKTKDRPVEIKSSVVNVIMEDGKINQMVTKEAQKLAEEQGLDLILLNNSGDVPVVKIGDYNKYLYEKNKKAKAKNIPVINEEQFMKMAETGNYI